MTVPGAKVTYDVALGANRKDIRVVGARCERTWRIFRQHGQDLSGGGLLFAYLSPNFSV